MWEESSPAATEAAHASAKHQKERVKDTARVKEQRAQMLQEHPAEIVREKRRPKKSPTKNPTSPLNCLYDTHEEKLMQELEKFVVHPKTIHAQKPAKEEQPQQPPPLSKKKMLQQQQQEQQEQLSRRLQQKSVNHRQQLKLLLSKFPDRDHRKQVVMLKISNMRTDCEMPLNHTTYICPYHKVLQARDCQKNRWAAPDSLKRDVLKEGGVVEANAPPVFCCLGKSWCFPVVGTSMEVYLDNPYLDPGKPLMAEVHCRVYTASKFEGAFYAAVAVREREVIVKTDEDGEASEMLVVRERFYVQSAVRRHGSAGMYGNCCLSSVLMEVDLPQDYSSRNLCVDCTTNKMRLQRAAHPTLHANTGRTICFFVAAVGTRACYVQPLKEKPDKIPPPIDTSHQTKKDATTLKFSPTQGGESSGPSPSSPKASSPSSKAVHRAQPGEIPATPSGGAGGGAALLGFPYSSFAR
jgi:hypothetical protein